MDVRSIIKSLGGAAALARGIGLPGNGIGALRARAWSQRNAIPGQYWASIAAYSREADLGITVEVLADAHAVETVEAI